jgi:hypothetical protein
VEALATRVVKDSAFCAAFEDNKSKATAYQTGQRAFRIRLRSVEKEFVVAGKERVNIREHFPPIVKRFISDGDVRVDGNKPLSDHSSLLDYASLRKAISGSIRVARYAGYCAEGRAGVA